MSNKERKKNTRKRKRKIGKRRKKEKMETQGIKN